MSYKQIGCKKEAGEINKAVLKYYMIEDIDGDIASPDPLSVNYIRQTIKRVIFEKYPAAKIEVVEQFTCCVVKDVMIISKIIVAGLGKSTANSDLQELIEHCNTVKQELQRVCVEQKVPAKGIDAAIAQFTLRQMERTLFVDAGDWRIPRKDYGILYEQFIPAEKWLKFANDCETEDDCDTLYYLINTLTLKPEEMDFIGAKLVQLKLRGIC